MIVKKHVFSPVMRSVCRATCSPELTDGEYYWYQLKV